MANRALTAALMAASLLTAAAAVQAQPTPKEHYAAESKRIAARYAEDKKLCAEESSSSARMQCLRDAKKEYDNALAAAKADLKSGPAKPAACHECGKVVAVRVGEKAGEGSAVGLIAGGVAGALLGNQVGSGHGRQLATVAGEDGGGRRRRLRRQGNREKGQVHQGVDRGGRAQRRQTCQLQLRPRSRAAGRRPRAPVQRQYRARLKLRGRPLSAPATTVAG
ncbi:hypothetical protein ACLB1G_21380 [Oxalobacteraceae bacterium A2-2]